MPKTKTFQRAAFFQPFDSLQGFRQMLYASTFTPVEPKVLDEEELSILNRQIQQVYPGMLLKVTFIQDHQYYTIQGIVSRIQCELNLLQIVKTKIPISKIVALESDDFIIE